MQRGLTNPIAAIGVKTPTQQLAKGLSNVFFRPLDLQVMTGHVQRITPIGAANGRQALGRSALGKSRHWCRMSD